MDMHGKTCLITGANSGIGKATALKLAEMDAHIIMLCRNKGRAERAKEEIIRQSGNNHVDIILADLAVQREIRKAADQLLHSLDKLDVLVNNAGLIGPSKRTETPDGIELTLAVNHLAPFLLTNLLLDLLKKAGAARVVNVSSEAHRMGVTVFDPENIQLNHGYASMKAYGLSKLCNIMFTHQLAIRTQHSGLTTNALHPGVIGTQLASDAGWFMKLAYMIGRPFMQSPENGAKTSVYLATSDEVNETSGRYFRNQKEVNPAAIAYDETSCRQLWEISERLTQLS